MSVTDIQHEQEQTLPREDLQPYAGQWVALRGGHVIASDIDAVALRAHPAVLESDALIPVPRDGSALLVL